LRDRWDTNKEITHTHTRIPKRLFFCLKKQEVWGRSAYESLSARAFIFSVIFISHSFVGNHTDTFFPRRESYSVYIYYICPISEPAIHTSRPTLGRENTHIRCGEIPNSSDVHTHFLPRYFFWSLKKKKTVTKKFYVHTHTLSHPHTNTRTHTINSTSAHSWNGTVRHVGVMSYKTRIQTYAGQSLFTRESELTR